MITYTDATDSGYSLTVFVLNFLTWHLLITFPFFILYSTKTWHISPSLPPKDNPFLSLAEETGCLKRFGKKKALFCGVKQKDKHIHCHCYQVCSSNCALMIGQPQHRKTRTVLTMLLPLIFRLRHLQTGISFFFFLIIECSCFAHKQRGKQCCSCFTQCSEHRYVSPCNITTNLVYK